VYTYYHSSVSCVVPCLYPDYLHSRCKTVNPLYKLVYWFLSFQIYIFSAGYENKVVARMKWGQVNTARESF